MSVELFNRFHVITSTVCGEGGQGKVYKGRDEKTDKPIVLKVFTDKNTFP